MTATALQRHLALVPPPPGSRRVGRFDYRLSRREHEVLALIAAGRTNAAIAEELVISVGAVEKHIANIFIKLRLPATAHDHRRVLAALWYVRTHGHIPAHTGPHPHLDPAC
jgi:DNA-binding NarL/FixJ family response regulator